MGILKRNITANFIGNIWQVLMSVLFIPFYIKFMGVEAYGLIGVFAMLQGMFGLLDMGLGSTMNREMARLSALPDKTREMRDMTRTLEIIYWCLAIIIGTVIIAISPLIAHNWVKAWQLSPKAIEQSVLIMGLVVSLQMTAVFYSGGLMGLQRQVLLNLINAGMGTIRGAGAVLILWLVSPTIQAFFLWQILISLVNTFLLVLYLWRALPSEMGLAQFFKSDTWKISGGLQPA
jgi:hypothetical protein